jgi:hypothetical protein
MDVGAHLLPGLGRPEHADDGYLGLLLSLLEMGIFAQLGVISRWRGLVVVDAVQSDAEQVHLGVESLRRLTERESKWSSCSVIQQACDRGVEGEMQRWDGARCSWLPKFQIRSRRGCNLSFQVACAVERRENTWNLEWHKSSPVI